MSSGYLVSCAFLCGELKSYIRAWYENDICVCVAQNVQSRLIWEAGPSGLPNFWICSAQTLKLARFMCICYEFGDF